jgi:hypothetical protein
MLTALVILPSCAGRRFVTPAFYEKAEGHQIIAVLPYEMIFTGKKPKKLTVRQVREIEEAESLAFQESFYHMLFSQSTRRRYPIQVEIQPVDQTNRILERKGIGIRESWEMDSRELARVLRVDAIVRTRIIKHRFMSGLASFGIEVGNAVLNEILYDTPLRIFLPNPTKGIKAECTLHNARDGSILWGIDLKDKIDWTMKADHIIHHINHYFAKKFPYR